MMITLISLGKWTLNLTVHFFPGGMRTSVVGNNEADQLRNLTLSDLVQMMPLILTRFFMPRRSSLFLVELLTKVNILKVCSSRLIISGIMNATTRCEPSPISRLVVNG